MIIEDARRGETIGWLIMMEIKEMKCELEKVKSYALGNNEIENEWEWWKKEYTKSLTEEVFGNNNNKRRYSYGSIYCDPDEGNTEYYTQICYFLNSQEEKFILKNKRFHYCVGNYNGRSRINVCKDGGFLFCLKTDQFGFSVPKTENTFKPQNVLPHPYSVYYEQEKDKRVAIDNIVKWVYISRSLGGSFLWPEEEGKKQPPYNLERGGSRNPRKSSYINDRVDLTILELKHFYDVQDELGEKECSFEDFLLKYQEMIPGDILGDISLSKSPNLYKWLRHFDNFKVFIEYFEFKMFVPNGRITDISRDGILEEMSIQSKKDVKKDFWSISFEEMFNQLCKKIADRTDLMNKTSQEWAQNRSRC